MPHPLEKFLYCPLCGNPNFAESSAKSKRCNACGFEMFMNASAAAVAFIRNKRGELLFAVRNREPAKGTLDLPGGFSDIGETSEETIRREVMEETGLRVTSARFLFSLPNRYHYGGIVVPTLDMFYECEVEDTECVVAADDVERCFWARPETILPSEIGLESVRKGFERYRSLLNRDAQG